jgi:hypothetical protein
MAKAPSGFSSVPAFVGIGALKAGTTYLDGLLRGHPSLCLPRGLKEVDYFSRHYLRGSEWYRAQFDGCSGRLHGEISPRYLIDPEVPVRIANANPDARLILVVRDPVQRAYSQYLHVVRTTAYSGGFDEYLAANPGTVERGRYFRHAQRYLQSFDPSQLHIVVFDDLVGRPAETARALFEFLGVDAGYVPAGLTQAANASWQPSRPRTYALAKRLSGRLHDGGHGRVVGVIGRSPAARWLSGRPLPVAAGRMSEDTALSLRDEYSADVHSLSVLLGRDLVELWWARLPDRVT